MPQTITFSGTFTDRDLVDRGSTVQAEARREGVQLRKVNRVSGLLQDKISLSVEGEREAVSRYLSRIRRVRV